MKHLFLITFLLILTVQTYAQFGVSYHQSSIPFAGVNYQINERIISEFRIGVNAFVDEIGVELMGGYIFSQNETMQAYAGIGGRINFLAGVVLPVGLNIYPFEKKRFGFQAEIAPLFGKESSEVLRGSWGIRYRFRS